MDKRLVQRACCDLSVSELAAAKTNVCVSAVIVYCSNSIYHVSARRTSSRTKPLNCTLNNVGGVRCRSGNLQHVMSAGGRDNVEETLAQVPQRYN